MEISVLKQISIIIVIIIFYIYITLIEGDTQIDYIIFVNTNIVIREFPYKRWTAMIMVDSRTKLPFGR